MRKDGKVELIVLDSTGVASNYYVTPSEIARIKSELGDAERQPNGMFIIHDTNYDKAIVLSNLSEIWFGR